MANNSGELAERSQQFRAAPEVKKKWYGSMVGCMANMITMFGGPSFSVEADNPWEVPFEELHDLRYLGAGAQGMVFRGLYQGEIVAVKRVREKSETNLKHLRKLNHENIVRFRGVCNVHPKYCVIMEYCQYGSLYDFLHSGSNLLPSQLMNWAKEIALGMAYLHAHNIIHRDLKSPNVLISDNLTVKVSDFGTSREWENVSTVMSFAGTAGWMAPEMIRHEPCSDRVDVWSFGVVLFEIMTREIPYNILEGFAVLWGVGTDLLSLPIPNGLPIGIQNLMIQCWQRIPKNRPPFKTIVAFLETAAPDVEAIDTETFAANQQAWGAEVRDAMTNIYARNNNSGHSCNSSSNSGDSDDNAVVPNVPTSVPSPVSPTPAMIVPAPAPMPVPVPVRAALPVSVPARAQTARAPARRGAASSDEYDLQMQEANDLFMEVCTVRLQLEQREREIEEREKLLDSCHCGQKSRFKLQYQTSSSSEARAGYNREWAAMYKEPQPPCAVADKQRKKRAEAQLLVNYIDKDEGMTYTVALDGCACGDLHRNNNPVSKPVPKETQVEQNGNGEVLIVPVHKPKVHHDKAGIPDVAQV